MENIDAHELNTEAQQQLRYQVIRLKKQGRTYKDMSLITGVHCSTYSYWYSLVQSLQGQRKKERLRRAIHDKCIDQMKLSFALWTRVAIQQLIKQFWSIDMLIWQILETLGDYLRHKSHCAVPTNRIPRLWGNG
jgi:hypothetical protein